MKELTAVEIQNVSGGGVLKCGAKVVSALFFGGFAVFLMRGVKNEKTLPMASFRCVSGFMSAFVVLANVVVMTDVCWP